MRVVFSSVSLLALMAASAASAQQGGGGANTSSAPLNAGPAAVAASVASPQAGPSGAGNGASTVGEVIVTAQRRAENLQNVPLAVQAVGPAQLASAGVADVRELSIVVPGVSANISAGNTNTYIRGVGSQVTGPGLEAPVALYVDGVYYSSTYAPPGDLNDVAQVAVLKGPQGTLFGRNATGGLVQITTKTPSATPSFDADIGYGNYDTVKGDFYGTAGLAPNLAADFAINAIHQGDGYGHNLFNGKDVDRLDSEINARSKWYWTPTSRTKLTVEFDFNSIRSSLNSLRITPGTLLPPLFGTVYGGDYYDTSNNTQPVFNEKGGGVSGKLEQDVGFANLVDIVAYRRNSTVVELDIDDTPVNFAQAAPAVQNEREFTEELQLQSKSSGPLIWTGGVYYYYDNASIDEHVVYGPFLAPTKGQDVQGTQTTNSVAGYAQSTWEFLPRTHLTVGLRYTYENRAFDANQFIFVGAATLNPVNNLMASKSYYHETYRVALDHRFNDEVLAYASINTGFKSGGFNALAATQPPFGVEDLTAYAVGLKTDLLDRRLRVNMEGFYYDYSKLQLGVVLQLAPGVTAPGVINGGIAHDYGFDMDFTAQVTSRFRLGGGLEALHSRFASSVDDVPIGVPLGNMPVHLGSVQGNTPAFSPGFVGDLSADYVAPVFDGETDFNLTYQYNSGFFFEPDNIIRQPAFSVLNGSIRWKAPNNRYTIALWAKNLTDERVMQNELTISFGQHASNYQPPRTFGFTVGYHY